MSENNKATKYSDITCRVGLDEQNIPVEIAWKADASADAPDFQSCKAMLLSLFDKEHKDTFKIDLWTTDLQVNEMDKFMYQTLRGLADTYFKATGNMKVANDMQNFVQYFGEQTEVIKKEGGDQ